jgi:hypothetical protein
LQDRRPFSGMPAHRDIQQLVDAIDGGAVV